MILNEFPLDFSLWCAFNEDSGIVSLPPYLCLTDLMAFFIRAIVYLFVYALLANWQLKT